MRECWCLKLKVCLSVCAFCVCECLCVGVFLSVGSQISLVFPSLGELCSPKKISLCVGVRLSVCVSAHIIATVCFNLRHENIRIPGF